MNKFLIFCLLYSSLYHMSHLFLQIKLINTETIIISDGPTRHTLSHKMMRIDVPLWYMEFVCDVC